MKKHLYIITSLLLAASCVYPFDVELPSDIEQTLVVDGVIVLGGNSYVNISNVRTFDGRYTAPPSADILLEEENGATYPGVLQFPGYYRLFTEDANQDSRYRLIVVYKDKTYATDWTELANVPTIDRIGFSADDTDVHVSLSVNRTDARSQYLSVSFQEIWHFHATYLQELGYNPKDNSVYFIPTPDRSRYWCWQKSNSSGNTILNCSGFGNIVEDWPFAKFSRSSNRNHGEYYIKVNLRSMSRDEYRYWKNLNDNSAIGGNLFSPEPGDVPSNLRCITDESTAVYGYVSFSKACSAIASLDGRYYIQKSSEGLYQFDPEEYRQFYEMGYEPVRQLGDGMGNLVPGWGQRRCFDCVAAGGKLEKPEFDR